MNEKTVVIYNRKTFKNKIQLCSCSMYNKAELQSIDERSDRARS